MNAHFNTPTTEVTSISSSSMLVELGISTWTARKKDKSATADLLHSNGATKAAGAFNKNLLADCEELVTIQKFAANVRTMHYNMTIPWSDSGLRLLPTAKYFDYHKQMTGMQAEFDRLVQRFLDAYDWEVAQVHAKLGNLFHRDDYPTAESVRHKFGFRVSYLPVPDAGDWRVNMGNEAQAELRTQYEDFYQRQMERAMRDLWERLHTELSRFVNQLDVDEEGRKGKVYESTIDHVRNLADMLGHCNFTNDPALELAQRKLTAALSGVCRDDIVKNDGFRASLKRDMQAAIEALPSLDW
jgi:hypothetical protein